MRTLRQLFPMALLCALALFSSACGDRQKPEDELASKDQASEEAIGSEPEIPVDNELQPDVVTIDEGNQPSAQADLDAREQRLADRQAELEARERRLRERETPPAPRPAPRKPEPAPALKPTPEPAPKPEPAPEPEVQAESPEPEKLPEPAPRASRVTLPAGTGISVQLSESLSSATSSVGDVFRARVVSDISEDGVVVIPSGSEVVGEVTQAVASRKIGGQAKLGLRFTDLVLPSGSTVPIDASLEQIGRSQTGKDAATIGGAAAGGAILGRVLSKNDRSRGTVIGAIIGAAAGAAAASRNASEEVVIPSGTPVSLSLDQEVEVSVRR